MTRIVTEAYEKAKKVLEENEELLHSISEALLEYESLGGEDVDILMRGEKITRVNGNA